MMAHDLSFLLAEGPGELLERQLEEYRTLLRSADEVRREHLQAIDYAVRHWVLRLLVRNADTDELEAAYDSLRRLVPIARESELAAWVTRWRAFADLVDARLAVRANQRPEEARNLAHAETILDLVEQEQGLSQNEIAERLKLKPANLSRILRVLEAHEFIYRRVIGREKRVYSNIPDTEASPAAIPQFPFAEAVH